MRSQVSHQMLLFFNSSFYLASLGLSLLKWLILLLKVATKEAAKVTVKTWEANLLEEVSSISQEEVATFILQKAKRKRKVKMNQQMKAMWSKKEQGELNWRDVNLMVVLLQIRRKIRCHSLANRTIWKKRRDLNSWSQKEYLDKCKIINRRMSYVAQFLTTVLVSTTKYPWT